MNGVRIYFDTTDPIGGEVKCYGDYLKRRYAIANTIPTEYAEEVIVTDFGSLEGFNGELKKSQPYWLLPIVESKKSEIIFPDHEGKFDKIIRAK